MSIKNTGKCSCGKASFFLELPEELETYSPRECDCDFCTKHKLSYLSHAEGSLNIDYSGVFNIIKQGSEQAKFLSCSNCGDIVTAVYQFEGTLKGAVNANLLAESEKLQESTIISPKLLAPDEKLKRWESLWLKVLINGNSSL